MSFNSKLSYEVREFLRLKNKYIKLLTTCKIAGHQDRVKQQQKLTFEERINTMCDHEAKELIREQIRTNSNPALLFPTYSPWVFNKDQQILSSTESIRDEIFMHIAAPYLLKKLNITSLNDIDYYLRKQMLTTLSSPMLI